MEGKKYLTVGLIALAAYAAVAVVQMHYYKIPIVGPYLPGA